MQSAQALFRWGGSALVARERFAMKRRGVKSSLLLRLCGARAGRWRFAGEKAIVCRQAANGIGERSCQSLFRAFARNPIRQGRVKNQCLWR